MGFLEAPPEAFVLDGLAMNLEALLPALPAPPPILPLFLSFTGNPMMKNFVHFKCNDVDGVEEENY
jgi:hypothetical protein